MNEAFIDHLFNWLGELNLPEPEIGYVISLGGQDITLNTAYPDQKLGLVLDETAQDKTREADGWTIWTCQNLDDARAALADIGERLGAAPRVKNLDFEPVETLVKDELFSAAKEKLDALQATIQEDHPDWARGEELGSTIRKALRKQRRAQKGQQGDFASAVISSAPVSTAGLLKADAQRMKGSPLPVHNFLGLFTPVEQVEMGDVDAVWVAQVDQQQTTVWPATVTGHPAYKDDPGWEMVDTDIDLLKGVLDRLGERVTFVWNSDQMMPTLRAWHFRAFGTLFPDTHHFIDLRALCLVVYPTAKRNDQPEALCREQNIPYQDAQGNGGRLAAMVALLQTCVNALHSLPDPLRAALREILAFPVWPEQTARTPGTALRRPVLSAIWLDTLLPVPVQSGFQSYIEQLENSYENFPLPVQHSTGRKESSGLAVGDFFEATGYLAQSVGNNYKERSGQIDFARKVAEATQSKTPHILEAGTGVGKTIGYLVPLLLSGKRCFISTHTKNLQDQAWTKDVPTVLKAFESTGLGRSVAILKGKNNYVCLQTVVDWLEDLKEILNTAQDAWVLSSLLHWLLVTKTGWLNEVDSLGQPALVSRLGRDQAPPTLNETWTSRDPHTRAKQAADSADVVLVNHSFVFALAKNQTESEIDILLFDEAHNIEDVVTEALTLDFLPWSLQAEIASLVKRDRQDKVQGLLRALLEHPGVHTIKTLQAFNEHFLVVEEKITTWCRKAIDRLAEMAVDLAEDDPDLPMLFTLEMFWGVESGQIGQELHHSAQELVASFLALAEAIETLFIELPNLQGLPKRLSNSLDTFLQRLLENAEALQDLLTTNDRVHWGEATVSVDDEGVPRIIGSTIVWHADFHSTPLDVAAWLRETLPPLYAHRMYVSATLAVQSSFANIIERLGISGADNDPDPVTEIFDSPFNFSEQVLLAVPSDTPTPRASLDPLYIEALSANIAQLVQAGQGRTLALFTSRRAMREVGIRLNAVLRDSGVTVLTQSGANRIALVERFKEAPDQGEQIVLLGLRAFWEGVDVPGDALQILVITRLPFDFAGHPVAIARKEYYLSQGFDRDYFREVIIPTTYLHLRQMYGRLIRREDDRGVCVVLDPRIYSTRYGKYLLASLPGQKPVVQKNSVVLERVRQFLGSQPLPEEAFDWGEPSEPELDLSKEQQAIIDTLADRILVRAAAGSGKTSVLTRRIVKLVQSSQVQPDKVLALTFTNKAQNVMIDRLEVQLGSKAFDLTRNVLTYHKLASRIIRQDDRGTGHETKFLDENNPELQSDFLAFARQQARLTEKDLPDEDALTIIAYAQNGLVDERELVQEIPNLEVENPYLAQLARFFLAYVGRLRDEHLIDYGEAIVKAVRILRQDSRAKQMWSGRFDIIFCDEYQDTTPAQAALLSLIGQHKQLFVVGDSAQSIYSWQGADPDNLRRFEIDFPNTSSFELNRNYRCFPKLVRVSNRFLERCGQAHGIKVVHDEKRSNEIQNVYYLTSNNDWDEAKSIATVAGEALQLDIQEDPPQKGTVGVLARKWQLLDALEVELIRGELPYRFEGETARGLSAGPEIQPIISRAVDLLQWADDSTRQMGDSPDGKAVKDLRSGQITLATELLERAQKVLGSQPPVGDARRRYERLLHVLENKPTQVIQKLYGNEAETNKIVLSTVHSQKGEEFDTVFIIGLEKGNTPHNPPKSHAQIIQWRRVVQRLSHATWRKSLTDDDLQRLYEQEEQRIFYVAMTRARLNLVICQAEVRNQRPFKQSEYLDQARVQDAIREVAGIYDVALATPVPQTTDTGYRTDGRVYQTSSGVRVRSKSEMLLANELTRRGIYFEYEEPLTNVPGALPDFTFPDYGGIILEHLGLLDDPNYVARWEIKAKRYEDKGISFFQTNEQEIQNLDGTVDRLHDQFRQWVAQKYGSERLQLVDKVERLRRKSGFQIGRNIGEFEQGIFECQNTHDDEIVAIAVIADEIESDNTNPQPPDLAVIEHTAVTWNKQSIVGIPVWMAKGKLR